MKKLKISLVAFASLISIGLNTFAASPASQMSQSTSNSATTPIVANITNVEQLGNNLVKVTMQDGAGTVYETTTAVDAQYASIGQSVEINTDPNDPQGFIALLCALTPAAAVCLTVVVIIVLWPKPAH